MTAPTVLVVDDRSSNREYLSMLMKYVGLRCLQAGDGREALALARTQRPDLIITDILMPTMDGYELVQHLRADEALREVPVIFYTATYSAPEAHKLAAACGVSVVLPKPSEPIEILEAVNRIIRVRAAALQPLPPTPPADPAQLHRVGEKLSLYLLELKTAGRMLAQVIDHGAVPAAELSRLRQVCATQAENLAHLARLGGRLRDIIELGLKLGAERGLQQLTHLLLDGARGLITAPCVAVGVHNPHEPGLRLGAALGLSMDWYTRDPSAALPPLLRAVVESRNSLRLGPPEPIPADGLPPGHPPAGALLAVPLATRSDCYGWLSFSYPPGPHRFTDEDERVAITAASGAAMFLENAALYGLIERHAARLQIEAGERKRAQQAQRESEERLQSILGELDDTVWSTTPDGAELLYLNPAAGRLFGYTLEQFRADPQLWVRAVHPDDRAEVDAAAARLRGGERIELRHRIVRPDGAVRRVDCRASAIRDATGEITRLDGIFKDVTVRHEQEQKILRLSRIHRMLSAINTLIVHTRDRALLLRDACRIAVDLGGLRMAWIGTVDEEGGVTPVAQHGVDDGYLALVRSALAPSRPHGEGPTTLMLQSDRPFVCNDTAAVAPDTRWCEETRSRGFRAVAVFPLRVRGRIAGCLDLYAAEAGFFDDEEVKLLADLAGNIAYAMEFIASEQELDYLASYDSLTQLPNRRLLSERLEQRILAARTDGRSLALVLVDLEHFRHVNNMLGRDGGDEVLRHVGARLLRFAGTADGVARLGGDQFAVMIPEAGDTQALAGHLEERLWHRLARPYKLQTQEVRLASKLGIAVFPGDGDDAEGLLRNAEAALKQAKSGGHRMLFYTQSMSEAIREKLNLETQLRRALEQQEFVLHYQPKVSLADGRISGAEALIRWNSPALGLVPPGRFIGLLEEIDLIGEVGRWALEQALADHRRWLDEGLPDTSIAVNVSPMQLRQPDFIAGLREALSRVNGDRPGLQLEVTESLLMDDVEGNIGKLRAVRDLGIGIAIDDFGTGYSSLSYLTRLPIAALKIDRSFVVNMTDNADTMSIVSTIMMLAHSMKLSVIAEGVESTEQLKFLRLMRCDEIQGFLFSPALDAGAFAGLLAADQRLHLN